MTPTTAHHQPKAPPVQQGDVYWIALEDLGIPHPYVVLQDNVFNASRLKTVIVCALTSNIQRVSIPGNVLLEVGEANLPKQSVVEISKITSVDKTHLDAYIGSLSAARVNQILAGMRFVQMSFFDR